jgi:hypothetical protein
MNRTTKTALVAVAIAAAAWSAQAQTAYNGDLVIGFTGGGSANDFEFDLGRASAMTSGETWSLGANLSGFTLGSTSWGVVGTLAVSGRGQSWFTIDTGVIPAGIPSSLAWGNINNAVKGIYGNFSTAGAGQSATPANTDDNSWNQQTINGALSTQYHNVYDNPNIASHNPATPLGAGSMDFYQITAATATLPGVTTDLGVFTLDNTGTLTFTAVAVPEPTTYGLLAGLGLLVLSIRRVWRRA